MSKSRIDNEDSANSCARLGKGRTKAAPSPEAQENVIEDTEVGDTSRSSGTIERSNAVMTSFLSNSSAGLTNDFGELPHNRGNIIDDSMSSVPGGVGTTTDEFLAPSQEEPNKNSPIIQDSQASVGLPFPANFASQSSKTLQVEGKDTPPSRLGAIGGERENKMFQSTSVVNRHPPREEDSGTSKKRYAPKSERETNEPKLKRPDLKNDRQPLTMTPDNVSLSKKLSKTVKAKPSSSQSTGRWTQEEHEGFLEGLKIFGREWKKVAKRIPTRTPAQIRSHAQKYFAKQAKEEHQQHQHQQQQQQQQQQQRDLPGVLMGSSKINIGIPISSSNSSATVIPALPTSSAELSSTALDKVQRILADPAQVQREVEDTLRALHERYRQLQFKLQNRQNRGVRNDHVGTTNTSRFLGPVVVEETSTENEPIERSSASPDSSLDDKTKVCTSVSQSSMNLEDGNRRVEDVETIFPIQRQLESKELIALHVLRGGLASSRVQTPISRSPISDDSNNNSSKDSSESDGRIKTKKPRTD